MLKHLLLSAALIAAVPGAVHAQAPATALRPAASNAVYAQHLVERAIAAHPEVVILAMHVTPPGAKQNVIIASNLDRIGKPADEDDLRVVNAHSTNREVNKAGNRYEVELPLLDASRRPIGALGVVFAYTPASDKAALERTATALRDEIGRRISHVKNLMEPFPYDNRTPSNTRAQAIVDELFASHPEVAILAFHATPPGQTTNVILGSTIGRIGKKADEDDVHVLTSGETKLELDPSGDRYEVEMAVHDRARATVGALGVVFAYAPGDDKAALKTKAEAIRDAFQSRFATLGELVAVSGPAGAGAGASGNSPLAIVGRTELPGYTGDFDHFGYDLAGNRLFLAAEDHGTLEVFNLRTGAHLRTIPNMGTPHTVVFQPKVNRLLVTDGSKTMTRLLNATTYAQVGTVKLTEGADSAGYDRTANRLWVVTGGKDVPMRDSYVSEIDPATGKRYGDVHFDADHVEAMAVEQHGPRIYINVTDKNYVAVIDKATRKVVTKWPVTAAAENCCFAFDEPNGRLFMVTRKPGKLIVLNSHSGATIATFDAPLRTDEVVWDAKHRRVYVLGGEGYVAILQQKSPDSYTMLPRLMTAPGAKTGIVIPELNTLYVAASPGESGATAKILRISTGN